MKAFQYLAALGLGAVVTLGDTLLPVMAQPSADSTSETERTEQADHAGQAEAKKSLSAEAQIAASAIALVPHTVPEAPSSRLAVAPQPEFSEPDAAGEAADGANGTASRTANGRVVLDLLPVVQPSPVPEIQVSQVAQASDAAATEAEVQAETAADAMDAMETVQEPSRPERLEEVPVEGGEVDPVEQEFNQEGNIPSGESAGSEVKEAIPDALGEGSADSSDSEPAAVAESSASATTLVDEQPNLFRPDDSNEVSIEVNEAISLEAAIEIARQNSPSIRIRQLQLEQSLTAVDEARAAYAPQFSINGNFDNTGTLTTTQQLYREPNAGDNDSNARDAVVSLSGNARVDYGIIDPDRKARVDAAEIAAGQSRLTLEQDLAELRLNVSQAYYQLQEADEQVKISEQAVTAAQRSLKDAQALEAAGVGTRFAVLQADVQLANEQQNLVNNLSAQQQSRRQLAQILSTPEKLNLTASDPVASAGAWRMTLEQSIIEAYQNRVELDNQLLQRDLSEAQRRIALSTKRPTLTAFAQVGPGLRWDFNRTNPEGGGGDTTSGIYRGTMGYQTGLRFQWLFGDGGATRAAARQQALNQAIADENFEVARDLVRREVEDAFYDLAANLRNISTSEQGVIQADEALRLARLRFQAGVGTQSEVVDAERDLTTAQGNRVSAVLNYNRALVAMQRAIGETLDAPAFEPPAELDQ